jgi:hypothetical protein
MASSKSVLGESSSGRTTGDHSRLEGGAALDWPLSRNEKKSHVLRLYDRDMRAANSLLQTGDSALSALRQELQHMKAIVADPVKSSTSLCDENSNTELVEHKLATLSKVEVAKIPRRPSADSANQAAMRLQQAIAEATEALGALLGVAALEQEEEENDASDENSCRSSLIRGRARSEDAGRFQLATAQMGGLRKCRKKRLSRGGEPLRVSFADGTTVDVMPEPQEDVIRPCTMEKLCRWQPTRLECDDGDGEPEPSPEAPPTPERSPVPKKMQEHHTWQRTVSRQRSLQYRRHSDTTHERAADEAQRGRRLQCTADERLATSKAPQTAMDFI